MIRLFVALWLITGNAMAVENAKPRGMLGGMPAKGEAATDPASKEQKRLSEKEKSAAAFAKQVLELPPLTPEQIEKFQADDAWKAGLRQGSKLQQQRGGRLPGMNAPWND
jgi:hypothetical protein